MAIASSGGAKQRTPAIAAARWGKLDVAVLGSFAEGWGRKLKLELLLGSWEASMAEEARLYLFFYQNQGTLAGDCNSDVRRVEHGAGARGRKCA